MSLLKKTPEAFYHQVSAQLNPCEDRIVLNDSVGLPITASDKICNIFANEFSNKFRHQH